ncbi:MAG: cytochrome C [gamma proteobacterium symbiont of Ctena orbiculata]|uniref:Cytochrome P460 family protein n=1 Tax=Candidatus Thiodiazotropha taylori TaxID=2792791 RepID=A0A944QTV0_9GAMM|nr:cytochrome P460 family protein [Candidatus Thiodiazotropha taylori]PUB88493.1 MAG: cytochrome C [gamma proteobacterium symbiont of Ctena orbiculata]MBT2990333.1 cytochrome P460 family protein [Candidatus Thiodiazotropha taylori]MBT2997989.1 cytochrome P460 family protein [Candidatus Thiodiazotropha taylori]MBT3002200.1 cytochrome P460 family protein [Candidatus Thiodiazotropha taylori]
MKTICLSMAATLAAIAPLSAPAGEMVPYPEGYRDWTHAKSMVIQPGHPLESPFQGIHHIYVNDAAKKGLLNNSYGDGAVIVFDLLNYTEAEKSLREGSRKLIGVMHKDRSKYANTGGWGFEAFAGDSSSERIVDDGGAGCFGCHQQVDSLDYVFTKFRE